MIVSTGIGASDNDDNIALNDAQAAIERTYAYTGIDEMRGFDKNSITAVQPDTLTDDQTPFLSDWVNGRPLWKIHIEGLLLYYKKFDIEDTLVRTMDVLLDVKTGVLISIVCETPHNKSLSLQEPSAKTAEKYMLGETYLNYPAALPGATFCDFANLSVFESAYLKARYVNYTWGGRPPEPTWIVDYIYPADSLNGEIEEHIRQFIVGESGETYSATTAPPYEKRE